MYRLLFIVPLLLIFGCKDSANPIAKPPTHATFNQPLDLDPPGLKVGTAAPEIEGEDLDGKKFKLSDYKGKVVMLDFWFTR